MKTSISLNAANRLLNNSTVIQEGQYSLSYGANSFKFPTPEIAYEKAAAFINHLKHDGFKFNPHGTMSKTMDVFNKEGIEISISVRSGILNIDLW
jgi:hypothetical protein